MANGLGHARVVLLKPFFKILTMSLIIKIMLNAFEYISIKHSTSLVVLTSLSSNEIREDIDAIIHMTI